MTVTVDRPGPWEAAEPEHQRVRLGEPESTQGQPGRRAPQRLPMPCWEVLPAVRVTAAPWRCCQWPAQIRAQFNLKLGPRPGPAEFRLGVSLPVTNRYRLVPVGRLLAGPGSKLKGASKLH